MSRRARASSHYIRLAAKLSAKAPELAAVFLKYTQRNADDPNALTGAEKAAIQRQAYIKGVDRRKEKRDDVSWINSARTMSKFVPSLAPYKKLSLKTKLTAQQKSQIAHRENQLRYAHHLIPLKGKKAKEFKDHWFAPGIPAIQLDHTEDHAKLHFVKRDLFVTNNGKTWLYLSLDADKPSMKKGARRAFKETQSFFPVEDIRKLVQRAFRRPRAVEVYLWATPGRVGQGYKSLKQFMLWFNRSYGGYTDPDKWVKGIAVRLGEAKRKQNNNDDDLDETRYEEDDEIGEDEDL